MFQQGESGATGPPGPKVGISVIQHLLRLSLFVIGLNVIID